MCDSSNHWNNTWHVVFLMAERDLPAGVAISFVTSMTGTPAVSKPGAPLSILHVQLCWQGMLNILVSWDKDKTMVGPR